MATKAGKIQFKDVRQGRVFWQVRCDFSEKGIPRILAVERLVVAGRPYKMMAPIESRRSKRNLARHIERRVGRFVPAPNNFTWHFKTLNEKGELSKYGENLSSLLKKYTRKYVSLTGDYNLIFTTENTAQRYAQEFSQRIPNKHDWERIRYRHHLMSDEAWMPPPEAEELLSPSGHV